MTATTTTPEMTDELLFSTPEANRRQPIRSAEVLAFQVAAASLDTWPAGPTPDAFSLRLIARGAEDAANTIYLNDLAEW